MDAENRLVVAREKLGVGQNGQMGSRLQTSS